MTLPRLGQLTLVEGPSGSGRSTSLEAAAQLARDAGLRVRSARADSLEREVEYGVALELLGPAFPTRPLLAVTDAVTKLAGRKGLALFVDDAPLADFRSLQLLAHLARRLEALPVALVISARDGEVPTDTAAWRELRCGPADVVRLEPLQAAAAAELLRTAVPGLPQRTSKACHRACAGNPLLLTALARDIGAAGGTPRAARAAMEAPAPEGAVGRAAEKLLGRVSTRASAAVRVCAVLGEDAELRRVAGLTGKSLKTVVAAADELAEAAILASASPPRFAQPLLQAAVYGSIPAAARADWHGKAAELLRDEGAATDRVAAHLLLADGNGRSWAVDLLRKESGRALAGGSPGRAARLVERALLEPPAASERPGLLADMAEAEAAAGVPDAADRLAEAVSAVAPGPGRAGLALRHGRLLFAAGHHREAADVFEAAVPEAGSGELATELQAAFITGARLDPERYEHAQHQLGPLLERDAPGASPAQRVLLAEVAIERALAGAAPAEVRSLAERAWADGRLLEEQTADGPAVFQLTGALTWTDEFELSEQIINQAMRDARRRGSVLGLATASYCRAWPHLYRGAVELAVADARLALGATAKGWEMYEAPARAVLALACLEQNSPDAAEAALGAGQNGASATVPDGFLLEARGRVRLAQHRFEDALADFEAAGEVLEPLTAHTPFIPWRSGTALAAAALEERARAVAAATEEVAIARAVGAPRALGTALTASGVVQRDNELLREAVDVLKDSPAALARAHAVLELGAALRRDGQRREARDVLREALDLAQTLGAQAVAARATDELQAAGARPRREALSGRDSLTPSELRVAELAAEGLTNREIAAALYVTPKTVQYHLGNAYLKLGVNDRGLLAEALRG